MYEWLNNSPKRVCVYECVGERARDPVYHTVWVSVSECRCLCVSVSSVLCVQLGAHIHVYGSVRASEGACEWVCTSAGLCISVFARERACAHDVHL